MFGTDVLDNRIPREVTCQLNEESRSWDQKGSYRDYSRNPVSGKFGNMAEK